MCLYPKLIKNPKYKPNKKNGYNVPPISDERTMYVPIGCGVCIECMKKKAREWKIRLSEEIKTNKNALFVTLTFSDENLEKLCKKYDTEENNAIATIAVRLFLERYRKKNKKSIHHWLITEMGHNGTERIHLHGLLWNITEEEINNFWQYGNIWVGEYVNDKTINYITKYTTKLDKDHKNYKPVILNSKGIGKNYVKRKNAEKHKYQENNTNENYIFKNGAKAQIPIYYRNKIYTEEQREKLWIEKLDKQERWVLGKKIDTSTEEGITLFERVLEEAQKKNKELGYGDDTAEWKKQNYNVTNRKLKLLTWQKHGKEKFNKL